MHLRVETVKNLGTYSTFNVGRETIDTLSSMNSRVLHLLTNAISVMRQYHAHIDVIATVGQQMNTWFIHALQPHIRAASRMIFCTF
jgi:hypothetical protein